MSNIFLLTSQSTWITKNSQQNKTNNKFWNTENNFVSLCRGKNQILRGGGNKSPLKSVGVTKIVAHFTRYQIVQLGTDLRLATCIYHGLNRQLTEHVNAKSLITTGLQAVRLILNLDHKDCCCIQISIEVCFFNKITYDATLNKHGIVQLLQFQQSIILDGAT